MRSFILAAFLFASISSPAQYYYKDIVGTKESSDMINIYRNNKVRSVVVNSYDADNTRIDNLLIQQQFFPATQSLSTTTKSNEDNQSILTTFIDAKGRVVRTIDSSAMIVSRSTYSYDAAGRLVSIVINSSDSANTANETEEHIWQYNGNNIARMLRIKNKIDTTYVDFKLDKNGNIIEEQETHKGKKSDPVYYYYNDNNQLTDIVRFNNIAKRLLPEYMFEYSPTNQVIQRITVPANSSEYTIWRYQYDSKGLKTKEAIYNKQKQLTGKVEYQYSFGM